MAEYNALSTQKLVLLLLSCIVTFVNAQISDKRLCADRECKVVISKAKALGTHPADHPLLLSFQKGDIISVTSKSAGSNPHLWGGEFDGHSGYFDKNFVKEFKVLVENPLHEVDTGGNTFDSVGKPPSLHTGENHRRKVVRDSEQDTDGADDGKNVETENDDLTADKVRKSEHVDLKRNDDIVDDLLNMDDTVDDLLKKDDSPEDLLENDETDLSEFSELEHDQKKIADDNHDDDDDEEEEKDDDLNQFLKNKLFPHGTDEAEGTDHKSELGEDEESLKVEPEASREASSQRHVKNTGIDRQKQSSESVDRHSVDVNGAKDDNVDVPSEVTEQDSKSVTKSDEEDAEGNQENIAIEADDFDPTEIDESSQSEFEENERSSEEDSIMKEDNSVSEKKLPVEVGNDVGAEEDFDSENGVGKKTSEYDQEERDLSKEKLKAETDDPLDSKETLKKKETDNEDEESISDKKLKEKSSLKTLGSHHMEETAEDSEAESTEENNVSKMELKEKLSTKTKGLLDLKDNQEKNQAKNIDENKLDDHEIGKKRFNTKEKENGGKSSPLNKVADRTNSLEEQSDEHGTVHSDVRPDTPSGTLSPEYGQGEDPVASKKSQLDTAQTAESLLHKRKETGRKHDLSESENPSSTQSDNQRSHESSNQSGKIIDKNSENDQNLESQKSTLDHVASVEEDKPLGDGFVSFLQSSRAEPRESDLTTETPKLNRDSTATFIKERVSDSISSKLDLESSKINDHRQRVTEDDADKKVQKAEDLQTIVEGGSTIVLDGEGNLVTALLPEDQESRIASTLPVTFQQMIPTTVKISPKPSDTPEQLNDKLGKKQSDTPLKYGKGTSINNTHSLNYEPGKDDFLVDNNVVSEAYQSSDFNSRKVLSVNQSPVTSQQQQQVPPEALKKQTLEDEKHQEQVSVEPTPALPFTASSAIQAEVSDVPAEMSSDDAGADDSKNSIPSKGQADASDAEEQIKEALHDQGEHTDEPEDHKPESTTQPITDNLEIPPLLNAEGSESTPEGTKGLSEEYGAESVYHSRKITDENLLQEEEKFAESSPGFFKRVSIALEMQTKDLVQKLPPSVQSVLESLGLLSNMKVVVVTFMVAMLISMSLTSCFPGGSNKKQQREMLMKFDEIEKKRLIDIKEKQNLEDEVTSKEAKNAKMKEEITKLKEESKKNMTELHTLQVQNDTLKKQVASYEEQIEELKHNANSKQGEVKQQSKKTKDLEKQIKKLEERERNLEQTAQKVMSDLKHKEEEVTLLTSKVTGLTDQVGHLETSKSQLLAEAEDWREKVSDLKERLSQRVEEFKQMQETIMFKENELEVLKDCFLQLKSLEENEEGENPEDANARVQEKIASMMDVSKMNASLLALEEEKNSLANKLEIELEARRELEEQLENSRRSVEISMADKMKAERQCQEAQTKLSVLSSYFKEKELQLQRELGEQEALKKQNQNKLVSADETTKTVQQEVEFVRTQNESLKRELASSERDFRSQIAANEKKAHENWLAARAAERELKEARHEAGVLRQKLTDIERRQFMGPGGLIRPLPTRGMPPSGVMNGPPLPGMERPSSRGSMPPLPPLHMRDEDFIATSRGDREPPPFPHDSRRGPLPPPGMRPPFSDARSPPPRVPPFGGPRSPPLRMPPPPGMMDGRSPPPYERRPPPHHMLDRRSPPFRHPPPHMFPPPMRGGPLPPPVLGRGVSGSPVLGPESPRLDGRYPYPSYGRNPPPPSDRPSPKQSNQSSPRQQQSHV